MQGAKSSHSHAACWSDWWSVWTNTLYPCLCSLETLALWPAEESIQLIKWVTLHSIRLIKANHVTVLILEWMSGWIQLTGGPLIAGHGRTNIVVSWLNILASNVFIISGFHGHWNYNAFGNKYAYSSKYTMRSFHQTSRMPNIKYAPTSFKENWK